MELGKVIAKRRMVRAFTPEPVPPATIDRLIGAARRAPSAGNSQGWDFLVLDLPADVERFWSVNLPASKRATFAWPQLLDAPVLVVPLADPQRYLHRYAEPDKIHMGRGASEADWPVPYWTVDASFATMLLLLAAVDEGLGALFFGLFERESAVKAAFGVPADRQAIGVIAIGWADRDAERPSRSARRPKRPLDEVVHRGGW